MSKFAMHSGRLIDINNFTQNDVSIEDIAHHLSKIQRFNGATDADVSYTVGEHCINLCMYAINHKNMNDDAARMLLLHDASEAYVSDLVSPVKNQLADYQKLENKVQRVIFNKFLNIDEMIDKSGGLKQLDKRILIDEVEHTQPNRLKIYEDETGLEKLGCHIEFNNHSSTTKQCFLTLAKNLGII